MADPLNIFQQAAQSNKLSTSNPYYQQAVMRQEENFRRAQMEREAQLQAEEQRRQEAERARSQERLFQQQTAMQDRSYERSKETLADERDYVAKLDADSVRAQLLGLGMNKKQVAELESEVGLVGLRGRLLQDLDKKAKADKQEEVMFGKDLEYKASKNAIKAVDQSINELVEKTGLVLTADDKLNYYNKAIESAALEGFDEGDFKKDVDKLLSGKYKGQGQMDLASAYDYLLNRVGKYASPVSKHITASKEAVMLEKAASDPNYKDNARQLQEFYKLRRDLAVKAGAVSSNVDSEQFIKDIGYSRNAIPQPPTEDRGVATFAQTLPPAPASTQPEKKAGFEVSPFGAVSYNLPENPTRKQVLRDRGTAPARALYNTLTAPVRYPVAGLKMGFDAVENYITAADVAPPPMDPTQVPTYTGPMTDLPQQAPRQGQSNVEQPFVPAQAVQPSARPQDTFVPANVNELLNKK